MDTLRNVFEFVASALERIREPGWPRRIAILIILIIIMLIPYPLSVTGNFEIVSLNQTAIRSRIEGTVEEVLVKMGDTVEAGQVTVRLLDVKHQLAIKTIDAEISEAEAELSRLRNGYRKEDVEIGRYRVQGLVAAELLTRLNLKRQTGLLKDGAVSTSEYDKAKSEHVQARKSLGQARQERLRLENGYRPEKVEKAATRVAVLNGRKAELMQQLQWTEVRATSAGRVISTEAEIAQLRGQYILAGTQVLELVSEDDLVARINVDESEFGDVELGQDIVFRAYQFPSLKLSGSVESIELFVEKKEGFDSTVSVLSNFDDPKKQLRVNTTGKAKISVGTRALGFVIYRRFLRSTMVQVWSWY